MRALIHVYNKEKMTLRDIPPYLKFIIRYRLFMRLISF